MNVFVIPFWYPSSDYPLNGIFIKEQLQAVCRYDSSVKIGVGLWGQKDERYLLWLKDHFRNLQKLKLADTKPFSRTILPNYKEFHHPTFTWTRKLLHGNRQGILKAMLANLDRFENDFGPADFIHAHVGEVAGQLAMELARRRKLPYIITEHMGPFPGYYASDKIGNLTPTYLKPYLNAVANIAVSPFLEQEMKRQSISRTIVIPNFVDEDVFKPVLKQRNKSFTFFTLARITSEKGIDTLLHAIKLVREKMQDIKFTIGGDGKHLQDFKDLAEMLGISDCIEWLGELNREEAVRQLQECDTFVLPSHYESFGVVYAEAIACGKPVIATRCGGPESIVNDTNGLLVEVNNPQALAEAMSDMVKNYNRYDSAAIREDFMNRFSKKAIVPQLMQLYKIIITRIL
ncbi:glycosyltransferase [Pontibacter populi]|uniref:Glycosyltransferase n=1 Tax=Pontibacter populi TaxID=890055 RepID=A0ABV1RYK7_9BACT